MILENAISDLLGRALVDPHFGIEELKTVPPESVHALPDSLKLAYDHILLDVLNNGSADAERILSGADGDAGSLRGIFADILTRTVDPPSPDAVDNVAVAATMAGRTDPEPADIPDFNAYRLTDSGNAELLAARYGRDLRYDHARRRWVFYPKDGHRWHEDRDGTVYRLAVETARARYLAAPETRGDRTPIALWATRSENRDRIGATLHLAGNLPPISDKGEGWDETPHLVGTPNGVLDTRTGKMRPGKRSDKITLSTGVTYNPDARAPRWFTFLDEITQGDLALIDYIQRAVGYTLTGTVVEEILLLLHGHGANGKSKFLSALRAALGDYSADLPFSTFENAKRNSGAATPDLADLPGRRLVTSSEGAEGVRWDERRVKWLTGRDPVTARRLYGHPFTFRPAAVFWLSTNHRPRVHDETESFWRRIHLVPFNRTFAPGERDLHLEEKLLAEKEGVLAWIVQGALQWKKKGLTPPEAVRAATAQYREEEDPIADFLADRCVLGKKCCIPSRDLYRAYTAWAESEDAPILKQRTFGTRLTSRGFKRSKGTGGTREWCGLELLPGTPI